MAVELALPVANWQNKTSGERVQDIASVALEWQRKTNIYWTTPSQLLRLVDTNRSDNETYLKETTATIETVMWAAYSDAECLGWISTEKEDFYKCARVILSKKYTDGKEIRILSIAECVPLPPERCVEIYEEFAEVFDTGLDAEEFRDRPVEFNLAKGKSFDDLVKSLTGRTLSELMAIKLATLKDATKVEQNSSNSIAQAHTKIEQIFVGAKIEQELIKLGYRIDQLRDCPGESNLDALKKLRSLGILEGGNGVMKVLNPDRYKYDKLDTCLKCNQEKMIASPPQGCGICRDCQIYFDLGIYQ